MAKTAAKTTAPADKPKTAKQMPSKTPSAALAAVIGPEPVPMTEAVKKFWVYVKANNLQNPANKQEILADAKLKPIFGGADKIVMFKLSGHLINNLS